jgi:predicted metal-dependent hydrolase
LCQIVLDSTRWDGTARGQIPSDFWGKNISAVWSNKLGVHVHSLAVRPMRNKWAPCSTAGNLNFSDDLLALDRELVDYVIVHELLHFYVPNHGKLWKSLMRAHLGDYERAESKLRTKAAMLSGQQPIR